MNEKQQKYILEKLLSSSELFSICSTIIKPEYFDPKLRPIVDYTLTYYNKFNDSPTFDDLNSRYSINLEKKDVPKSVFKATSEEIEEFCKDAALTEAVIESMEHINNKERGKVREAINKALLVSLQKDLGVDIFSVDMVNYLLSCEDDQQHISCGIAGIDDLLGGGPTRRSLTMFSAMSGGGKSLMLNNIGLNYAKMCKHVVYFSLELPEKMIALRSASIATGVGTKVWKENKERISATIRDFTTKGAGSFTIKKLPFGSSTNDLRAYLKQYELEHKRIPDIIIVDYLDIMHPNGGVKGLSVSERDKASAEELVNLLHEYDAIGFTASQQNRESLRMSAPDQGVIAGGMTKVNTVDNYIALSVPENLKGENGMFAHALKTRSSDGVGKTAILKFDRSNLQIGDPNGDTRLNLNILAGRKQQLEDMKEHIKYEFSDGERFPEAGEFSNVSAQLVDLIERINEEEANVVGSEPTAVATDTCSTAESINTQNGEDDDVVIHYSEKKPSYKTIIKGLKL